MKQCKAYISVFLLLVFTWVVLPAAFVHEVFADHQDTECLPEDHHKHEATHVEALHKHCDVFRTNVPVYDAPALTVFEKPIPVLTAELCQKAEVFYFAFDLYTASSRGPPLA